MNSWDVDTDSVCEYVCPKTAVVVVVIRYMVERQQWPFHGLQHQASCRAPTLVNEPLHYPTTLHAWNIARNTLCCTD
jgi:hypothetical protein